MAGPSKVEFPGQKQQRLRLRGTKRASQNVQQRLRKNLDMLVATPEVALPEMRWDGRLPWGRTDPVTKTLREIAKVLDKRHYISWLNKRMMSKRGDAVAKAWAGALAAAHEDGISLVGTFNHPIYGNSSFVRKGDAKPIIAVGVQNHRNVRLRLLTWEGHARKGWFFFSWSGGFVCTGNSAKIPDGWLGEVVTNLDTKVEKSDDGYVIGNIDDGCVILEYIDGTKVRFGADALAAKRKSSLIAELALPMLPPKLTEIAAGDFSWRPEGWPEGRELPQQAVDAVGKVIIAWMELGVLEADLWGSLQKVLTSNLGEGIAICESWFGNDDIDSAIKLLSGSDIEREAAAIGISLMVEGEVGARIGEIGEFEEREDEMIWCLADTSHHLLSALWEDYGEEILLRLGIAAGEAEKDWKQQLERKTPFGKFLRGLESKRAAASLLQLFPWGEDELDGICGQAHELVLLAQGQGAGRAHAKATKMRGDIATQALGWAWLSAHGKESGQEWHFEQDARDRGSGWSLAIGELWEVGCSLVDGGDGATMDDYVAAMKSLASACGERGDLPPPSNLS
ncbi:MAG TPA: hypothetical protein EYO09_02725 [Candidatus Poseidoniales archaeon]|nr:hypothetical protein [Candidatus Poseidoniales archaeon]